METEEAEANKISNEEALFEPCVFSHLEERTTAKEGWNAIKNALEHKFVVRISSLFKQWIYLKLSDCALIQDYMNQSLTLRSKVRTACFIIVEEIAGSIINRVVLLCTKLFKV